MVDRDKYVIKEIEIIQSIISRMANNSFLIKGWVLTVIVGTFLIKIDQVFIYLFTIIPIIFFWWLDAYFLRLERLYRKLYDWVIKNRFNTDDYFFDMNFKRFRSSNNSLIMVMFSSTLICFYIAIIIILIGIVLFRYFVCSN